MNAAPPIPQIPPTPSEIKALVEYLRQENSAELIKQIEVLDKMLKAKGGPGQKNETKELAASVRNYIRSIAVESHEKWRYFILCTRALVESCVRSRLNQLNIDHEELEDLIKAIHPTSQDDLRRIFEIYSSIQAELPAENLGILERQMHAIKTRVVNPLTQAQSPEGIGMCIIGPLIALLCEKDVKEVSQIDREMHDLERARFVWVAGNYFFDQLDSETVQEIKECKRNKLRERLEYEGESKVAQEMAKEIKLNWPKEMEAWTAEAIFQVYIQVIFEACHLNYSECVGIILENRHKLKEHRLIQLALHCASLKLNLRKEQITRCIRANASLNKIAKRALKEAELDEKRKRYYCELKQKIQASLCRIKIIELGGEMKLRYYLEQALKAQGEEGVEGVVNAIFEDKQWETLPEKTKLKCKDALKVLDLKIKHLLDVVKRDTGVDEVCKRINKLADVKIK